MGRRTRGEGTIYKRGNVWHGELTLGWDADGKRLKKRFHGATKRSVADQIAKAKTEHNAGTLTIDSNATLSEFLAFWLPTARQQLRHGSYQKRAGVLTTHIIPAFGHLKLTKLTRVMVQMWINRLAETRAPNTVRGIHSTLHKVLSDAVRLELLGRNAASGIVLPRSGKTELTVLTPAQAAKLFETARGDDLEALYVLAVTTGMREGELFALHWGDIDWERRQLQVTRSMVQVGREAQEQDPKTRSSRRGIPLTSLAIDALKRRKVRQMERRLAAGARWQESELVFTTRVGRPLSRSHLPDRYFYPLLEAAGLPRMHFHDLRHSMATILLSMGTHPKIVQELLGHSNITMTMNVYSHVSPTMSREAINQLDTLLSGMTAEWPQEQEQ